MAQRDELIKAFYGADPLRARDVAEELAKGAGDDVIRSLVPLEESVAGDVERNMSMSAEPRMKRLAESLGSSIAPHLVDAICNGPRDAKYLASRYYAGLKYTRETSDPLIDILKKDSSSLETYQYTIEALGFLGVTSLWAEQLSDFAQGARLGERNRAGEVEEYALEKLSPATIRTLVRFAGKASSNEEAARLLRCLTNLVLLREQELPSHHPSPYDLVRAVRHEFSNQSLDALISQWGKHKNKEFQKTCFAIIGELAPRRAICFSFGGYLDASADRPELIYFCLTCTGRDTSSGGGRPCRKSVRRFRATNASPLCV